MGFRRIDTIKRHLKSLYCETLFLDSTPADAVLDPGDLATPHKKARNTTPVPRSTHFGEVLHMDIVFGPEISIGTVHYGLMFTDRHSRMTYIYPLHNLTTDIPKQINAFFAHLGFVPHRLITDFDLKLIGGKERDFLNSLLVHVNAAPPNRQEWTCRTPLANYGVNGQKLACFSRTSLYILVLCCPSCRRSMQLLPVLP
jgi:hypothetical protein